MKLTFWAWLLWAVPFYLVLEVGLFLIVGWALNKSVVELVGPYLAFAAPLGDFSPVGLVAADL
jgi:hypothetical protein